MIRAPRQWFDYPFRGWAGINGMVFAFGIAVIAFVIGFVVWVLR